MKLSIKHSSGATIDIDGSQEECLAALHALFGYPPVNLQGIQPATQPFIPTPLPWTPQPFPSPITPWSPIIWGTTTNEQQAPWAHGTLLMTYNKNPLVGVVDTTQPSGYRVEHHGVPGGTTTVKLQPLTQADVFREMGLAWAADALEGKSVSVYGNDFDKSSSEVHLPHFVTGLSKAGDCYQAPTSTTARAS